MDFLSKQLEKSDVLRQSYVRTWAAKRCRELQSSKVYSLNNFFAVAMYCLSTFGVKDPRRDIRSELESKLESILPLSSQFHEEIEKHFSGDATLFEVGCYMLCQLGYWLTKNMPHREEEIIRTFTIQFLGLFTKALGNNPLPLKLMGQRVTMYMPLIQNVDVEGYRFYLEQLILHTKNNQLPKSYDDFENTFPAADADILDYMNVKIEQTSWERLMGVLFESVKMYCDLKDINQ